MKPAVKVTLIALLILAIILGGLYWYSYHFGIKKEIDLTLDAVAILEAADKYGYTVLITADPRTPRLKKPRLPALPLSAAWSWLRRSPRKTGSSSTLSSLPPT